MGRRYERLLFLAGPLALACLLVLFVAVASDEHQDRRESACLKGQAQAIESNRGALEVLFADKRQLKNLYWRVLEETFIQWEVSNWACRLYSKRTSRDDFKPESPQVLIDRLRSEAALLDSRKFAMYGVQLPEGATLSVLGAPIKVELTALARIMQVVLGPLLLLWLGCLYNTRHRETLYIARMTDVSQLYPHLVNMYPTSWRDVGGGRLPRKRSWLKYGWERFGVPAYFVLLRLTLVSAFVAPPTVFYAFSLFRLTLGPTQYAGLIFGTGLLVVMFGLAIALCEAFPWHLNKRFLIRPPVVT